MIEYLWRMLTDKRVDCAYCGQFIGYVVRKGHAHWYCSDCTEGGPRAVFVRGA